MIFYNLENVSAPLISIWKLTQREAPITYTPGIPECLNLGYLLLPPVEWNLQQVGLCNMAWVTAVSKKWPGKSPRWEEGDELADLVYYCGWTVFCGCGR